MDFGGVVELARLGHEVTCWRTEARRSRKPETAGAASLSAALYMPRLHSIGCRSTVAASPGRPGRRRALPSPGPGPAVLLHAPSLRLGLGWLSDRGSSVTDIMTVLALSALTTARSIGTLCY